MKRYSKGIWRGEDTMFEHRELKNGGKYRGEFLVFDDGPNYLGSVLFLVHSGQVSAVSMKYYWEFKDRDLVPNEF